MSGPVDPAYQTLLAAVARRDRDAFRALYDAASPKLFAIVLRMVGNRGLAEDIAQDVFLRIWLNASSYEPGKAPAEVWMSAIARNRAIDVLRGSSHVRTVSGREPSEWLDTLAEGRDRESEAIDNAALRQCLGTIEPQARDCVLLAYHEGYSREELAQRFGRPVNTIKTWLHRALGALRACLEGSPQ